MIARRVLAGWAGLAVVLWLPACTGTTPDSPPHTPTVTARPPAPGDCGGFVLDQGQQLSERAVACLIDAAGAHRAARLQVTRPTAEGDPITTTYVMETTGVVHVSEDATLDQFGDGQVHRSTCTGPGTDQGELTFARCT